MPHRAQGGLAKLRTEKPPSLWPKFKGGFSMYGYLQNVKMNVNNATRHRPKFYFSARAGETGLS